MTQPLTALQRREIKSLQERLQTVYAGVPLIDKVFVGFRGPCEDLSEHLYVRVMDREPTRRDPKGTNSECAYRIGFLDQLKYALPEAGVNMRDNGRYIAIQDTVEGAIATLSDTIGLIEAQYPARPKSSQNGVRTTAFGTPPRR